jgi:hypothetical protein
MAKYPIFEQCKNYTLDEFWRDVLEKASKGKFPDGVSYDPTGTNTHTFSFNHVVNIEGVGKKITARKTCSKNPLDTFKAFRNGLQRKGIFSPQEVRTNNNPIFRYTRWNQIKAKIIKEELLVEYVREKYPQDHKQKLQELCGRIQTKNISPSDIVMEGGKISSIIQGKIEPVFVSFPPYEYPKKTHIMTDAIKNYTKERKLRL